MIISLNIISCGGSSLSGRWTNGREGVEERTLTFTSNKVSFRYMDGNALVDFNKYSAITIIDRQNLESILTLQKESMSGNYSEEDYIGIGKLTNAHLVLHGNISKAGSSYVLELSISDVESGERKASYSPRQVSASALENLSAVKEASADLLAQLGVSLTDRGLQELARQLYHRNVTSRANYELEVNAELFDENGIFLAKATGNDCLSWLTENEYHGIDPGQRAERFDEFNRISFGVGIRNPRLVFLIDADRISDQLAITFPTIRKVYIGSGGVDAFRVNAADNILIIPTDKTFREYFSNLRQYRNIQEPMKVEYYFR